MDSLSELPVDYFPIIGALTFSFFKWAIIDRKKKYVDWVGISVSIIGAILFVAMGDGFLTMICEMGYIDDCIDYYIDAQEFWYFIFGAVFGTFLMTSINILLTIIDTSKKWAVKIIKNGKR